MTHSEFEKHKQELIRSNKLKSGANGLTYQIQVDENQGLSLFVSKEDDILKNLDRERRCYTRIPGRQINIYHIEVFEYKGR
jgi:hypothetical protein